MIISPHYLVNLVLYCRLHCTSLQVLLPLAERSYLLFSSVWLPLGLNFCIPRVHDDNVSFVRKNADTDPIKIEIYFFSHKAE